MRARNSRTGDPRRAVGYVRVSTDEQSLGPEAQRAALDAWAVRRGVDLVAVFEDRGVSGALDLVDRPELVAALARVKVERAGVLVVARRDRLARDVGVALAVEAHARRLGAVVASADGTPEGDEPSARFLRGVLDLAAEHERALIRARTREALAALKARGAYTGGKAPWGSKVGPSGALEPDPGELAVVERVKALRGAGRTLVEVVERLGAEGVRGRTGAPLGLTQVARLARGLGALGRRKRSRFW